MAFSGTYINTNGPQVTNFGSLPGEANLTAINPGANSAVAGGIFVVTLTADDVGNGVTAGVFAEYKAPAKLRIVSVVTSNTDVQAVGTWDLYNVTDTAAVI